MTSISEQAVRGNAVDHRSGSAGRDITLLPRCSQAPLACESGLTSGDATSSN
jgi:hypothetical protein